MKASHLFFSLLIVVATSIAWFILGGALEYRTHRSNAGLRQEVGDVWGPPLVQQHPQAWYATPNAPGGRATVLPAKSDVNVDLGFDPKQRGLLKYRTYEAKFQAEYLFTNPTKIPQTFYISFPLPERTAGLHEFHFQLGEHDADGEAKSTQNGEMLRAVVVKAGESIPLKVSYRTRGVDSWNYRFALAERISGFQLAMHTNFGEINFPQGTGSATKREVGKESADLRWEYPDVLSAPSIGMDMPKLLNAGPVASRIAFFAPVSLLFFLTVVLLIGGLKGVDLHPMHVFFIATGFFAFHLLFAYLVDLLSLQVSFAIASVASVVLVCGYLRAVGGEVLFRVSVPAQIAYLVLFSLSFFFDGLTGITLAIGSVATLALLMVLTAKVDWSRVFVKKSKNPPPPPMPNPSVG